jgi:hypothetical protein
MTSEPCPIHGSRGRRGDCDLCLSEGKNIVECERGHGLVHVEATTCVRCAGRGEVSGRVVKRATTPRRHTGDPAPLRGPTRGASAPTPPGGRRTVAKMVAWLFYIAGFGGCAALPPLNFHYLWFEGDGMILPYVIAPCIFLFFFVIGRSLRRAIEK